MSNWKHTKGPWRATDDGYIAAVGGGYVPLRTPFRADAFTDGPNRSEHPEEKLQANAKLAAAAPELLEACDEADTAFAVINIGSERPLNPQARKAMADAWKKVQAAIAKATGRADLFKEESEGEEE